MWVRPVSTSTHCRVLSRLFLWVRPASACARSRAISQLTPWVRPAFPYSHFWLGTLWSHTSSGLLAAPASAFSHFSAEVQPPPRDVPWNGSPASWLPISVHPVFSCLGSSYCAWTGPRPAGVMTCLCLAVLLPNWSVDPVVPTLPCYTVAFPLQPRRLVHVVSAAEVVVGRLQPWALLWPSGCSRSPAPRVSAETRRPARVCRGPCPWPPGFRPPCT